jgi:hypothetical protein
VCWDADGFIRGEVVGYGQQLRSDAGGRPKNWVAFARREELPGQHTTLEEVKAAVEAAR